MIGLSRLCDAALFLKSKSEKEKLLVSVSVDDWMIFYMYYYDTDDTASLLGYSA